MSKVHNLNARDTLAAPKRSVQKSSKKSSQIHADIELEKRNNASDVPMTFDAATALFKTMETFESLLLDNNWINKQVSTFPMIGFLQISSLSILYVFKKILCSLEFVWHRRQFL